MKKWKCVKGFVEDDGTLWLTKGKLYKEDELGFMVFDEGTRWILNNESNFEHVKIIGNYLIETNEDIDSDLSTFTDSELLDEIKRRMEK